MFLRRRIYTPEANQAEGGPTQQFEVEGGLVPKALTRCHGLAGSDQLDGGVPPSEHLKS